MRISDWSSDVCSSDLGEGVDRLAGAVEREHDDAVLALLGLPVAEAQSVEPCNHGNGPLTCLGARYHPDDVRPASNRRLKRPSGPAWLVAGAPRPQMPHDDAAELSFAPPCHNAQPPGRAPREHRSEARRGGKGGVRTVKLRGWQD